MQTLPLITHPRADSVIAWRDGVPITAAAFLTDVARLGRMLPSGGHMLNACSDRYHFAVGLAAALCHGQICLLPSTHTAEVIRQLREFAPDAYCLTDSRDCTIGLPRLEYPPAHEAQVVDTDDRPWPARVPTLHAARTVAYVFTSGSTGVPVPHRKTWGALLRNVQAGAQAAGLNDGRQHAVIGTVPPQHMYGLESTILMVLQSANALVAGRTFYPVDIAAAIASVPRPRALVSTPVHMRALLGAGLALPPVDLIVSATSPLSLALAQELEAALQAPLHEIYGSTETGQIAMRRSTHTPEWTLFRGVQLKHEADVTWASGGHVESPIAMSDVLQSVTKERFLLHGRMADMINIAGKRNSLANLNLQLGAIAGVRDGAFYMPDADSPDDVTRLTAFVVAPDLSRAALMAALRERIDQVFLPRPLIFLAALPHNATGKLPREALQALLAAGVAANGKSA